MSARAAKAGGAAIPLRWDSLAPERQPQFPPRLAADHATVMSGKRARVRPSRRRRGLALGLVMGFLAAAAGAGVFVALDSLPPPEQDEFAKLVASLERKETPMPRAAPPAEAAPAVVYTGALVTPPPDPILAAPPEPEPVVVGAPPQPLEPKVATGAEPVPEPTAMASPRPEPETAPEPKIPSRLARPAQAHPPATFSATLKPAELNALVLKGEQFLTTGDLASARLFFGRAANVGDARGADGMARSYDPAVIRKLPVYGLAVDAAEAERWYAKARAFDAGKVLGQP
jgi:outer membrane biosynthesis protein TonB